jgi:hypothetical protein
MGEDDDGSETTETVDPVETVRPGDDNGGSVASASLRRSSSTVESGRVGGDRSVVRSRSSTNDPSLLLVPVSRVGTSVTLLARSNLSDGHAAILLASLVVRVAPVLVQGDARRVLGHAVSGGVVGADGRSATGLDAGLVTERALTVTTEVGTGRSGVEVTAVVLVAAVVVTVTGLGLCR